MTDPAAPDPIVVDRLIHSPDPGELEGLICERGFLTAQERRWPRRRITTDRGHVLVLELPRRAALDPGTILYVGPGWYVVLEAALEPVLAIAPRTDLERIRFAHEVGGQHSAIAMDGEELLVPDEPAMLRLACRLDLPWRRARRPFIPVSMGAPH
ncbi:MAG TPA: urease accessory protein UreE [Candidatus Methylomirabilis sp.]|nr:urease accessory protein UreE [Candidatus Methylomirabilis sp.]